jgi:hypothetical protein
LTEVQELIQHGAERGIEISEFHATCFLQARGILAVNPKDDVANKVVKAYTKMLQTGQIMDTFAIFFLPEVPQTEAEHEANREYARAVLARIEIPNYEVTAKCRLAKVYRPETPGKNNGRLEGIDNFKKRTGLSDAAILEMSVEQLATYA